MNLLSNNTNIIIAVNDPRSLGEGAVYCPITNKLLWIDITRGKIFIYDDQHTNENIHIDLRQTIGTVVPYTSNQLVAAVAKGICIVDIATKRIIHGFKNGNPEGHLINNRWNDGKCDPQGRLWAGTMDINCNGPVGGLYSFEFIEGDGDNNNNIICKKHLSNITVSNGIVWTKDGKTMYYIDTPTMNVDAFDFDGTNGTISNRRIVYTFPSNNDDDDDDGNDQQQQQSSSTTTTTTVKFMGYPDGMTIDDQDMLWIAMWDGWCIIRLDPIKGNIIQKYHIPSQRVTSCAFGGKNLKQLYVTTANCGLRLDVGMDKWMKEQPDAGKLFVLDFDNDDDGNNNNIKGVKASRFRYGLQ